MEDETGDAKSGLDNELERYTGSKIVLRMFTGYLKECHSVQEEVKVFTLSVRLPDCSEGDFL